MAGGNPATPPDDPPGPGSAYRVDAPRGKVVTAGAAMVANSYSMQLDLRPDLVLDAPAMEVSTKTEEYREKARKALQLEQNRQDIDLSSNWARKLTERTLDDRVHDLERYMHAKSRRKPYTWTVWEVVVMMLANNFFLLVLFTLWFQASFSANPFVGVLDTAELHASRIDVLDSESEQTRLRLDADTDTASLTLSVGDSMAAAPPLVSVGVGRQSGTSTLTVAGSAGRSALYVSAARRGAAMCVGSPTDCLSLSDGLQGAAESADRTLLLSTELFATDGSVLVNGSFTLAAGVTMVGQNDHGPALRIGSAAQPTALSVSGELKSDAGVMSKSLRVSETVEMGAGGALFLGDVAADLANFNSTESTESLASMLVRGNLYLHSNSVEVGTDVSNHLVVRSRADFHGAAAFMGDIQLGTLENSDASFEIFSRTALHAPMHARHDVILGSNRSHTVTISGDASIEGDALVHGSLTVLSDFATAEIAVTDIIKVGNKMTGTSALGLDVVGGGTFGGDFVARGSVELGAPKDLDGSVRVHVPLLLDSNVSCPSGTAVLARSELGVANVGVMSVGALNVSGSLMIDSAATVVWDTQERVTFRNLNITSDISTNGSFYGRGGFTMVGATTLQGEVVAASNMTIGGSSATHLQVMSTATFTQGASFDMIAVTGETVMEGSLQVHEGAALSGHVTLGSGPSDRVNIDAPATFSQQVSISSSRRRLLDSVDTVLAVDGHSQLSDVGVSGTATSGALNVTGNSVLGSGNLTQVVIDATANVTADFSVAGKSVLQLMDVHQQAKFEDGVYISGATTLADQVSVLETTTFHADVLLSSSSSGGVCIGQPCLLGSRLTVSGNMSLGIGEAESLSVSATSTFHSPVSMVNNVLVGNGPTSLMTVEAQLSVSNAATFSGSLQAKDSLSVSGVSNFLGQVSMHQVLAAGGGLQVGGDATFKDDLNGDLVVINGHAKTILMNGDLTVTGQILADGGFEFGDAISVDLIRESSTGVGVTIEGVHFIDGGLEFSRADIIEELYEGRGVSVEGVILRDGVLMIESTFPGVDPTGSLDAVTLKNVGCSQNMIGTETSIKFRQMFYHSDGVSHASAPAGTIAIGTETNWGEDAASQDSYFIVQTVEDGEVRDRMRISSHRVHVWQDMRIGAMQDGIAGNRALDVHARQGNALLRLVSDTNTARVELQDSVATFAIDKTANVLRVDASNDPSGQLLLTPGSAGHVRVADDMVVITAADGTMNVSGDVHVGNSAAPGVPRSLRIFEPSGGVAQLTVSSAVELTLAAASATDTVRIAMSGGADSFVLAQLGSTLTVGAGSVDGTVAVVPGLSGRFAVTGSGGADLLTVDGTTGTTGIAGNVSVGSTSSAGPRQVSVESADSDTTLELTAGNGMVSGLVLGSNNEVFRMSKVASSLVLSADDQNQGSIMLAAAQHITIRSGAPTTFNNDIHVQRQTGDATLLLIRPNNYSAAAIKFSQGYSYGDGSVFELSSNGSFVKLGKTGAADGVEVSDKSVDVRIDGEIMLHSTTNVVSKGQDALLTIAPTVDDSYVPEAATLRFNQHLHGDGTRTIGNCSCRAHFQKDAHQGGESFDYRCAPGTPDDPTANTLWCAVQEGCGFPNSKNVTLQYVNNFFSAPISGTSKPGEFDGSIGFEFLAQSNFKMMYLGRSVPPAGVLVDSTEVQLWSTQTYSVVASVTVGPDTEIVDGFAVVKLEPPLVVNAGDRFRLAFTAQFDSADLWYNNSSPYSLFNSSVATLTNGIYGEGSGYPIDNVPGQIVFGVPTFFAGDIWQETRISYWYDLCHSWSGAELSMGTNTTSLAVNLFGNTDGIEINPGDQGSLKVQGDLLTIDCAAREVASAGDVVVDNPTATSNLRIISARNTVRLTSSNYSAGYSQISFEEVGGESYSLMRTGNQLTLNDTGTDLKLVIESSGGTLIVGQTALHGNVTTIGKFAVLGNVILGQDADHSSQTVKVNSPASFARHVLIEDGFPGSAALTVDGAASFNGGLTSYGDVLITARTVCDSTLVVKGNIALGSDFADQMTVNASAEFRSNLTVGGSTSLGLLNVRELATMGGNAIFQQSTRMVGGAQFDANVQLGDHASDMITVNGTFHMNSNLIAYENVSLGNFPSDTLIVDATTTMRSPLLVQSSVVLGEAVTDTVVVQGSLDVRNDFIRTLSVRGDLVIKNSVGARQLALNTTLSKMSWTLCTDACGVKNGDGSTCTDACGVPNGNGSSCQDVCGVVNGDGSTCADACGVPNGDGSSCTDGCGVAFGNFSTCTDQCGVPNGDNSSCVDQCGVPNGNNACADLCGVPNGDGSQCAQNCTNNQTSGGKICVDACGVAAKIESCMASNRTACQSVSLSGNQASNEVACEAAGDCAYTAADFMAGVEESCTAAAEAACAKVDISGDDATSKAACENTNGVGLCIYVLATAGNSSTCADACGVPNGNGSSCQDVCGVVNGDGSTCADACGVPNGDGSSCTDGCGVAFGNFSTCTDQCGVPNGDNSSCVDQCGVPNGNNACADLCGVPNGDGSQCAYSCNENMYIDLGTGDLFGGGLGSFQGELRAAGNFALGKQSSNAPHASINVSEAPDAVLELHSLSEGVSNIYLADTSARFMIQKSSNVLRVDASNDPSGQLLLTPGSAGHVRVADDMVVITAADGTMNVSGDVHVGNSAAPGVPRSLRIFEPSGGVAQLTVSSAVELTLAAASATDTVRIAMSGGADSFVLAQLGSTLTVGAGSVDGTVAVVPGLSGRFAVTGSGGADLLTVDGTTGTTGIAGNVSVGSTSSAGPRQVSVESADSDTTLELTAGDGQLAGISLQSASTEFLLSKTTCPNVNGQARPQCSSLRLDAADAGTNGEVRVVASEIHVDNGHLLANQVTIRGATAVGFQGETIDLNSGQITSGASALAISPGPTAPNDPLPTETITVNNYRIQPTSLIIASVVSQCNTRSGVAVIKITPEVGRVVFEVANFGTRACGNGDVNQDERYSINFFLMGNTDTAF